MNVFKKKCVLPSKRVCVRLKNLRLAKKISLEQMETCTKINRKYLIAIENCNFEELDMAGIYKKNFIKKYVNCLNENPGPFIKQFEEEEFQSNDSNEKIKKCSKYDFSNLPLMMRYFFILLFIVAFAIYLWGHINNILRPPVLTIISPTDGIIVNENVVNITGTTEKETKININEEAVQINEKGFFDQEIILSSGINTVIITAESKHGKTTRQTLNIIFK